MVDVKKGPLSVSVTFFFLLKYPKLNMENVSLLNMDDFFEEC